MRFAQAAWHAAISWPSVLLAVVLTALTLHGVSEAVGDPGVNGWDVVVVQVSNLQLVPLLIAVVWVPVFLAHHRVLQREDELLRRGSWWKAAAAVVTSDAAIIIGALTLSTAAVLAVSVSLGLGGRWSDRVVGIVSSGGLDSEVSAAAAATWVGPWHGAPWLFLAIQTAWMAVGLLAWAALHAALMIGIGPRTAAAVVISGALWGVLSGAGLLGGRPFPDMSAWTNNLWAVSNPPSVAVTVAFWTLAGAGVLGAAAWRDGVRADGRLRLTVPHLAVGLALGLVLLYSWYGAGAEGGTELADVAFGGQYSSLLGHLLGALPAVVMAGLLAGQLSDLEGGGAELILLRHGAPHRWVGGLLGRFLTGSVAMTGLLVVIFAAADFLRHPEGTMRSAGEWALLAAAYVSFCCLLGIAAVVLFWMRGHVQDWIFVVMAILVLGYPTLFPPSPANPFAPYSLEPGAPFTATPLLASLSLLALLVLGLGVLLSRLPAPRSS
ncbi:hypothetical protein [Micrococcus terreus]|uniref:Uncharacterized protein n=1 Tax=Micrococcus terreus TaxID=574650 RepID=A0A1I7MTE3_9MICC|nr:hypothetical protein [Micrococcus terreus]SFV25181.1 hypothetical protein SAMN04487966_1247 [Micrococcus terreus]